MKLTEELKKYFENEESTKCSEKFETQIKWR